MPDEDKFVTQTTCAATVTEQEKRMDKVVGLLRDDLRGFTKDTKESLAISAVKFDDFTKVIVGGINGQVGMLEEMRALKDEHDRHMADRKDARKRIWSLVLRFSPFIATVLAIGVIVLAVGLMNKISGTMQQVEQVLSENSEIQNDK